MATEKMVKKAKRLLADGNVQIVRLDGEPPTMICDAIVKGEHAVYTVARTPGKPLRCNCASLKWRCSHVIAVELVTLKPRGWPS